MTSRDTKEMSTESREHLSSLMDGEINRETGRFLVRRLGADVSLRQTWARYHLIRDCLRDQDGHFSQADLTVRVREALMTEPPVRHGRRPGKHWIKPLTGAALAASVALMAVLVVSQGGRDITPAASGLPDSAAVESFASPNIGSIPQASRPVNLSGRSPQNNSRMNSYLLRHYQVTGDSGGKGFVSFVPIVVTQAPVSESAVDDDKGAEATRK